MFEVVVVVVVGQLIYPDLIHFPSRCLFTNVHNVMELQAWECGNVNQCGVCVCGGEESAFSRLITPAHPSIFLLLRGKVGCFLLQVTQNATAGLLTPAHSISINSQRPREVIGALAGFHGLNPSLNRFPLNGLGCFFVVDVTLLLCKPV